MNKSKEMTLSVAVAEIKDGEKIVLGKTVPTPHCVVEELVRQKERFHNLSIFHLIYPRPYTSCPRYGATL